ncbi:hypothetical protein VTN00DRAFT_3733 [Thermoascus crustaceus]|uniref:uncharacterized protein n=1 Tax=Thermoascus crustaceus TaxID=5088 RepID=UPI0037437F18
MRLALRVLRGCWAAGPGLTTVGCGCVNGGNGVFGRARWFRWGCGSRGSRRRAAMLAEHTGYATTPSVGTRVAASAAVDLGAGSRVGTIQLPRCEPSLHGLRKDFVQSHRAGADPAIGERLNPARRTVMMLGSCASRLAAEHPPKYRCLALLPTLLSGFVATPAGAAESDSSIFLQPGPVKAVSVENYTCLPPSPHPPSSASSSCLLCLPSVFITLSGLLSSFRHSSGALIVAT